MFKKLALLIIIPITLMGCGQSTEEKVYKINQDLISSKFPVPDSLKFPKYVEGHVLCEEDICSIKGSVEYVNSMGVKVVGDYASVLVHEEDNGWYLYKADLFER